MYLALNLFLGLLGSLRQLLNLIHVTVAHLLNLDLEPLQLLLLLSLYTAQLNKPYRTAALKNWFSVDSSAYCA
jgi:hypothetical protein